MNKKIAFRASLGVVLAASSFAGTLQVSDFEDGTVQGWDIAGTADAATNASPGGVANGRYIFTEDRADGNAYFRAPASWAGNYLGDTLSFYLKNFNPSNPYATTSTQSIVVIQSSGGPTLYLRATPPTISYPPGDGWTPYSIVLDTAAAWSLNEFSAVAPTAADITNALTTITRVQILADFASGFFGKATTATPFGHDVAGLDNVQLGTGSTPQIPEPATWLFTSGGLIGLAVLRRRKA